MSDFKAQGVANAAWAFANVGQFDAQLCRALARVMELHVGEFTFVVRLCFLLPRSFVCSFVLRLLFRSLVPCFCLFLLVCWFVVLLG